MSKEEPRFSVMLTRAEVESLITFLRLYGAHFEDHLIERLQRRLRQRDTYEAQEKRLAADPDPVNLSGI